MFCHLDHYGRYGKIVQHNVLKETERLSILQLNKDSIHVMCSGATFPVINSGNIRISITFIFFFFFI